MELQNVLVLALIVLSIFGVILILKRIFSVSSLKKSLLGLLMFLIRPIIPAILMSLAYNLTITNILVGGPAFGLMVYGVAPTTMYPLALAIASLMRMHKKIMKDGE